MTVLDRIPRVVCFGEVLWDIFPTYRRIGGAPLNVAYNLAKMGINASIITKLGNDELGHKIIEHLEAINFPTAQCQIDDTCSTGTVFASFNENNEASYNFLENSAWDFIDFLETDYKSVQEADAFVFGTLATRNTKTSNTLLQLLEASTYKVYDVNFRPPHYDLKFVTELMAKSDVIKMNNTELHAILDYLDKTYSQEEDKIKFVQDHFKCNEIIITNGCKGGLYSTNQTVYKFPSLEIIVKDTVGSGDGFLAGFLAQKLYKGNHIDTIKKASALGAYITSSAGACPPYKLEDFMLFYEENIFETEAITATNI